LSEEYFKDRLDRDVEVTAKNVAVISNDFSLFKGEFFGVAETCINKDILTFKLDRITK
jgi:hypothetical protein